MPRESKYEVLVSARSGEEALAIASEALPLGHTFVRSEVEDASEQEGRHTYRVTIVFIGREGGGEAGG